MGVLKGLLRNATAFITGQHKEPAIGIGTTGQIYAVQLVTDPNGDPVPVQEIDAIAIVTQPFALATSPAFTILAANPNRKSLEFFNTSTTDIIKVEFEGVTADVNSWQILPQSYYSPPVITTGAVSAIAATGTPVLSVNEGT